MTPSRSTPGRPSLPAALSPDPIIVRVPAQDATTGQAGDVAGQGQTDPTTGATSQQSGHKPGHKPGHNPAHTSGHKAGHRSGARQ